MKKFLAILLGLVFVATVPVWLPKAVAQCNGVFPANTLCGNLTANPQPPAAFSSGGTVVGPGTTTSGNIAVWGNTLGTSLSNSSTPITSVANINTVNQFTAVNSFSAAISMSPFIGGTGVGRSVQSAFADYFSSADWSTPTAAVNQISPTGGGVIFVPTATSSPATLPTSFNTVLWDFLGPTITTSEEALTPNKAGRYFLAQDPGVHSGSSHTALEVDQFPVGSQANGQPNADSALILNSFKKNWFSNVTNATSGEIDVLQVFGRNAGTDGSDNSDLCGICINVGGLGTAGSISIIEGTTVHFSRATSAIDYQAQVQINDMNQNGTTFGIAIPQPIVGTMQNGYSVSTGTSVTNPFAYGGLWNINSGGDMVGRHVGNNTASTSPTAATCPGFSLATGSGDTAGKVTLNSALTCTVSFGTAFQLAPFCVITPVASQATAIIATTTTNFAVTFSTSETAFVYHCLGQ